MERESYKQGEAVVQSTRSQVGHRPREPCNCIHNYFVASHDNLN
jgi:hypothetical protein